MMAFGRRSEAWSRWGKWLHMYGQAHGVKEGLNFYLPPDLKIKVEKAAPAAKISLRQLAEMQGHRFEGQYGGERPIN